VFASSVKNGLYVLVANAQRSVVVDGKSVVVGGGGWRVVKLWWKSYWNLDKELKSVNANLVVGIVGAAAMVLLNTGAGFGVVDGCDCGCGCGGLEESTIGCCCCCGRGWGRFEEIRFGCCCCCGLIGLASSTRGSKNDEGAMVVDCGLLVVVVVVVTGRGGCVGLGVVEDDAK